MNTGNTLVQMESLVMAECETRQSKTAFYDYITSNDIHFSDWYPTQIKGNLTSILDSDDRTKRIFEILQYSLPDDILSETLMTTQNFVHNYDKIKDCVRAAYENSIRSEFDNLNIFTGYISNKLENLTGIAPSLIIRNDRDFSLTETFEYDICPRTGQVYYIKARRKKVDSFMNKFERLYFGDNPRPIKDANGIRIIIAGSVDDIEAIDSCYDIGTLIFSEFQKKGLIHGYFKDRLEKPEERINDFNTELFEELKLYVGMYEIQIRTFDIEAKCENPNSPLYHPLYKKRKYE